MTIEVVDQLVEWRMIEEPRGITNPRSNHYRCATNDTSPRVLSSLVSSPPFPTRRALFTI